MKVHIIRHASLALIWALVPIPLASAPSPALADRARVHCTSVEIHLPDAIVFRSAGGDIRARVRTNLAPGSYEMRYVARVRQFVISPLGTTQAVLEVSLDGNRAAGQRYQACIQSLRRDVPLVVVDAADSSPTPTRQARVQRPSRQAPARASTLDEARAQPWASDVSRLAQNVEQPLSATEVRQALQRRGIPDAPRLTSREVVRDPMRRGQWDALEQWEKDLWNEFLREHPDAIDITQSPEELDADAGVRFSMALAISYRYMDDGVRDAARELLTDSTFVATTMVAIMAYLALWVAPEPIFSKASAIISTIGLVAVAGFAATEIIHLARALFQLQSDTEKARTLRHIERAAERFGRSFGATSLRVLLALALIKGGKHMPRPPEVPPGISGGTPVLAQAGGGTGAVTVSRSAEAIQVLADGTIKTIAGGTALARVGGKRGGTTAGSGGSPGKWKSVKEHMSKRARAYQEQVTGRKSSKSYVVEGVRFDGYKNGKLIEAKGPGYKNFINREGRFYDWFKRGETALFKQAERQHLAASAHGVWVEWHIAEARFAKLMAQVVRQEGWRIKVVHTPRAR